MTLKRYNELEKNGGRLTHDELEEGWHFCPEWDGMLIGPVMPEMDVCQCLLIHDCKEW